MSALKDPKSRQKSLTPTISSENISRHFFKRKTKPAWFMETENDLKEMGITAEDLHMRDTLRKKVQEASFQEKPKLKTGKKWTEERKKEHSERMKEYWRRRKEEEKKRKRLKLRGPEMAESKKNIPLDQEVEDDFLAVDLLHRMDIEDIQDLKKYFFDEEKIKESDCKNLQENLTLGLSLSKVEFIEAIEKLAGSSMVALEAAKLFEELDVASKGSLRWENVLDAIIDKTKGQIDMGYEGWEPIDRKVEIHYASHCKREFIVKIVPLYTKLTFCYAVISKLGRVGVYDGEFNLLDSYKVALKPTLGGDFLTGEQEERQRRSKTTWITDAVFVPDIYALFFSASDCSLHLYDATGLIHVPLCLISGLKCMPTCMDYFSSNDCEKPSLFFFGDEEGDLTIMQFHQPKKTLFKKKDPDKLDKFLWSELKEQTDYVTYSVHRRVHDDAVLQVSYIPDSQIVLTCSNDPVKTMVLRYLEKRRKPYVFGIPKGIKCAHLEKSLHIIVTGSKDGVVRIWNQVVTKEPIICLHGHRAPVVDVRVLKHISAIISLSEKGVVKIWNVNEYYCQMTLPLNFPVFKIMGSKTEFGARSIFPGPTATNIFDELNQLKAKEDSKISSFTEEIETWLSARDFEIREDEEWSRNSLVVVCCNFMALLKLSPIPSELVEMPVSLKKYKLLPPPEREHFASIPTPWKVADFFTRTPPEESEESSTAISSNSSSTSTNMPLASKTSNIVNFKKVESMTADPVKAPMSNMNRRRTQFKIKQDQMKMLVEHCAPHLALDLQDLTPIKFSKPLPRTRQMIEKGIDVSDPELLIRNKLRQESTVTTGETISDIQSPHSSKSSKLPQGKKVVSPRRGRQTPDWFSEKTKFSSQDSSESNGGCLRGNMAECL